MKEISNKPSTQYINNGGQINIASDNSIINATFNKNSDKNELEEILRTIKTQDKSNLSKEEVEVLDDSLDTIEEQLNTNEPKKGILRIAIMGLTSIISASANLTDPLQKLIDFVNNNF